MRTKGIVLVVAIGSIAMGCAAKKTAPTPGDEMKKTVATAEAVPERAPSAAKDAAMRLEQDDVVIYAPIFFDFDSHTLRSDSQAQLDRYAGYLSRHPETRLVIEGNCDERGTTEYNLALGERRARMIREYLLRLGAQPAQLSTISYGEERPAFEGHDEAVWAKNRRGEFSPSSSASRLGAR